jgi:hypothetical protein
MPLAHLATMPCKVRLARDREQIQTAFVGDASARTARRTESLFGVEER